jgi:Uma2 family endonuclease
MVVGTPPYMPLTLQDYLELEEESSIRHEYVGGILHALAGASRRHNQIITNLITTLGPISNRTGCTVHHESVKLQVADDTIYYPDFMIVCDPDDTDPLVVQHPCVVVEVVSPSSRVTDRREKVMAYRRVPGLMTYLVIEQDEPTIQRHWRNSDGAWLHGSISDHGAVPIPCLDTELTFEDIYQRIDFSKPSS